MAMARRREVRLRARSKRVWCRVCMVDSGDRLLGAMWHRAGKAQSGKRDAPSGKGKAVRGKREAGSGERRARLAVRGQGSEVRGQGSGVRG